MHVSTASSFFFLDKLRVYENSEGIQTFRVSKFCLTGGSECGTSSPIERLISIVRDSESWCQFSWQHGVVKGHHGLRYDSYIKTIVFLAEDSFLSHEFS